MNAKFEKMILPLAVAISPSGWANFCTAVGEIHIGKSILSPRIVVDISMFDTSRRTLGRNLNLINT